VDAVLAIGSINVEAMQSGSRTLPIVFVGLTVETPTKYQFVINIKAAKMLGIVVPPTLIARADEVIE